MNCARKACSERKFSNTKSQSVYQQLIGEEPQGIFESFIREEYLFSLKIKLLTFFLVCKTVENSGNVLPRELERQPEFCLKGESLSFPGKDTTLHSSDLCHSSILLPQPSPLSLNWSFLHLDRSS